MEFNDYATNEPDSLASLYEAGVDFPLVDDVAPMMDAARRLGIEPWKPVYRAR